MARGPRAVRHARESTPSPSRAIKMARLRAADKRSGMKPELRHASISAAGARSRCCAGVSESNSGCLSPGACLGACWLCHTQARRLDGAQPAQRSPVACQPRSAVPCRCAQRWAARGGGGEGSLASEPKRRKRTTMAYMDLSNDAMVAISQAWVNTGDVRKAIARYAPLAGLLTLIERAHQGVFALTTSTKGTANEQALAELTQQATDADASHDRAIRGAIAILDAATYVASDDKLRATLSADRAELYPSGSSITQATYAEESGAALALKKKLEDNPKLRKRVTRVKLVIEQAKGPTLSFTVSDLVNAQLEAGHALSEIEQKRRVLEKGAPLSTDKPRTASTVSRARTAWVRATTLLVDAANELDELSDEDRRAIFGALAKALEGVERRPVADDEPDPEGGEAKKG